MSDPSPECRNCGYYASVNRRTVNHGWHLAEWGECRLKDLHATGVMTAETSTCESFVPDPRRFQHHIGDATEKA